MNAAFLFVAMSFAVYRVTRFLISDDLIIEPRMWLLNKIIGTAKPKDSMVRAKLHYLLRCPYCMSAWITAVTILVVDRYASVPLPGLMGLAVWGGSMAVWRYVEQN